MKKRVFVTGGSGMLGNEFIQALADEYDVSSAKKRLELY